MGLSRIFKKELVLFFSAFFLLTTFSEAAFQVPFLSAQASSMGGVSLAALRDPAAVFTNPAAIAGLRIFETNFTYTNMFAGLSGVQNIGAGFSAAGLPTRIGSFSLGVGIFNASALLEERTVFLGFATSVGKGMQLGVTGKHLYHAYKPASDSAWAQDPVFANGTSRGAIAADVGLIVPFGVNFRLGLSVLNVNEPDVGLVNEDRVRRQAQAGITMTILGLEAVGDFAFPSKEAGIGRATPSFGLEKNFYRNSMALRLGASPAQWSAGMGLRTGRVGFDYAWVFHRTLTEQNLGSHTVGVRLQFRGFR